MRRVLAWTILAAAIAAPVAADRAATTICRRCARRSRSPGPAAVSEKARPPAEAEPLPPQARRPLRSSDLKWLHVRVAPKAGSKSGRVSVNVPLGLVRMFGDDWPIPTGPGLPPPHDRCHLTLGEILRALDSGPDARRHRGRRGDRQGLGRVAGSRTPKATAPCAPPATPPTATHRPKA